MSLAESAILQDVLDGRTCGMGGMATAALRQDAIERGMTRTPNPNPTPETDDE